MNNNINSFVNKIARKFMQRENMHSAKYLKNQTGLITTKKGVDE